MSQREICVIVQPCILCEGDMEAWHVYLDEETGTEEVLIEPLEHLCQGMIKIRQERLRSRSPR